MSGAGDHGPLLQQHLIGWVSDRINPVAQSVLIWWSVDEV